MKTLSYGYIFTTFPCGIMIAGEIQSTTVGPRGDEALHSRLSLGRQIAQLIRPVDSCSLQKLVIPILNE